MLSVLHKISSKNSISRWILSRTLIRYLHPSDDQILEMANLKRKKSKGSRDNRSGSRHGSRHRQNEQNEDLETTFKIPKNTPFVLEAMKVRPEDLNELKFYPEYQSTLDFSLCALMVFVSTELFVYFFPKNQELNIYLIWCFLVIGFSLKTLLTLTRLYFKGDESIGERSMCITAGGIFFLVAMIVLIAKEEFLELGLNPAYDSFNASAYQLLEGHGVIEHATGPLSKLIFKFWLAVACGFIGSLFMFPGLRFGQMHKDSIMFMSGQRINQLVLNISFVSPLFILLLWIKPVARSYLTEREFPGRGVIMTDDTFESLRIISILIVIILRSLLMNQYLQSYLNLAPNRLVRMRKEAGTITNIQLKRMIAGVFYYLSIVALQFLAPLLLLLFSTLLFKVMGDHGWTGSLLGTNTIQSTPIDANGLNKVFSPIVWRGIFGFTCWWLTFVWFTTSIIGFVYHSYYS